MENIFFKEYFASLNSGCGFKNYYPSVLSGIGRLVILKGTPGSGKSGIMKKAATYAEKAGYFTERIFCSSDPDSLDGVVIRELDTAIIDGTAPHTADPKYPVVSDMILNTADFADERSLLPHKDEIIALSGEKERHNLMGYRSLASRGVIRQTRHDIVSASILYDKMLSAVKRIFNKEIKSKNHFASNDRSILIRACASFGSGGLCVKDTFANAAKIYKIDDKNDIAPIFLSFVLNEARERSFTSVLSPDPFDPDMIFALYVPGPDILFCSARYPTGNNVETSYINSDRFIIKDQLKEYKNRLKFLSSCIKTLEENASDEFKKSREAHIMIESFYTSSMDFASLDKVTNALFNRLFL